MLAPVPEPDRAGDQAGSADPAEPDATEPAAAPAPAPRRGALGGLLNGGTVAVLTWLIATPVAFVIPSVVSRDPFSAGATTVPIAGALCLIVAVFLLATRRSGQLVAGLAAGLGSAWIVLMLRSALYGTPFGFGGLFGDMGRMSASATRYTTTLASTDTLIPSLPSEYPPFYAWLVGRASVLLHEPAWRLVADAEVLFTSAAVLGAFLMWRRLVSPWIALAIAAIGLVTWSDPRKAFEVLTLAIFVPWVLEVFARTPRRMHWLPAGLIGGLIVVTYQAWMVYSAIGVLALVVIAWRDRATRWSYLRRLGLIVAVAFVASSWYVVPFVWASLTKGGQSISDLYVSRGINMGIFPFLDGSPIGLLQFVGLVGLVWLWRSAWWARPLGLIVIGVYGYRLLSMLRYGLTQHTGFLHYTARLYGVIFTIAGILVLAHVAPIILRRLRPAPPRMATAALLAVALAASAITFTMRWMPESGKSFPGGSYAETSGYAAAAFAEPLPGGGYPKYAPSKGRRPWFPVDQVQQAVERVLGPKPDPVTLSTDDRLFSYLPWPGYLDNDRTAGSTLSRWDDRRAEIRTLAGISDPRQFAERSGDTPFGPIDVFVLHKEAGTWNWQDEQAFQPTQFSPQYWTIVDGLPEEIVVAIRR
ncbi:arabinofuranosyltransferase [Micromonospora sp. NPDC049559]|uniref:arabinofuranosyltransferase n=1 Tax=Micromonospora sp. NPDC049559 TaxID=3155923 RepID=UPI00343EDCDE